MRVCICFGPSAGRVDWNEQRLAQCREVVLDAAWRRGQRAAGDQAVGLQSAQGLGEHLRADSADVLAQLAVAVRPLAERGDNNYGTGVGNHVERRTCRAVGEKEIAHRLTVERAGSGTSRFLSGCEAAGSR